MPHYAIFNGKIVKENDICISANNRSFRYGDGFFETMKMASGKLLLQDFHFDRVYSSLDLLQFTKPSLFTADYLSTLIKNIAVKNGHQALGRIRLNVFRGDGGLYDVENHSPNYLIQTWQLNESINKFNENGLIIDVYEDAIKTCDKFSGVKSNNYLGYAMAALWAKDQKINDCVLKNSFGHIADATIANVFIVKDGIIKTPPLTDGPVNGVMRRYLLKKFGEENIAFEECSITASDLHLATEIFLTNVICGIKWVKQFGRINYSNPVSSNLYKKLILPLYA